MPGGGDVTLADGPAEGPLYSPLGLLGEIRITPIASKTLSREVNGDLDYCAINAADTARAPAHSSTAQPVKLLRTGARATH